MIIIFLALLSLIIPTSIFAQTTPANTISVTPSILHVDLEKDGQGVTLIYKNTTNTTVELSLSASDFTELEDGYALSYLEAKNAKNYRYALSSWISFDKTDIILKPKESDTVTVFINKEKLTSGGHYGAILAKMTNQDTSGNIHIIGTLSSLIFVRTNTGNERDNARIERFSPQRDWFEYPSSMIIRFHNTGNTDLTPYGLVTIKDIFGREVSRGIVNASSLDALPESIRRYDVPLDHPRSFLVPGIYTATVSLHFGKKDKHVYETVSYFSEGNVPILPISFSCVVLALVLIRFRKKAISKHS